MSVGLTVGGPVRVAGSGRRAAAGVLLLAWAVAVAASYLGEPTPQFAPKLVTAFLLWQVWRGASWSRYLLISLSSISAGFAVGLGFGIALGATGIVTRSLPMFALYAVVGLLLCTPPVRRLARFPHVVAA